MEGTNIERGKENRAGELLEKFNLHNGELIPGNKLQEIISQNEAEIVKGVTWNFLNKIRLSFLPRAQSIRGKNYMLKRRNDSEGKVAVDLIFFLETLAKSPSEKRSQVEENAVVFTYEADAMKVGHEGKYLEPDFVGCKVVKPEGGAVYENLSLFLEQALKPAEEFIEAHEAIEKIWSANSFPAEDAEKLKAAIKEFGNHEFRTRNGFEMIGSCLTVPYDFEEFVQKRFGISLKHCELTGARKRREGYSEDEQAELSAEKVGMEVHEASIYKNQIIIDWTSRQFSQAKPIPEIRDLGEYPDLKKQIEIDK